MTISENFDMERVVNDAMQGMLNDFRKSGISVVVKSETDIIKDEFSGLIWSCKNMVFEADNTDIHVDYWTNITSDGNQANIIVFNSQGNNQNFVENIAKLVAVSDKSKSSDNQGADVAEETNDFVMQVFKYNHDIDTIYMAIANLDYKDYSYNSADDCLNKRAAQNVEGIEALFTIEDITDQMLSGTPFRMSYIHSDFIDAKMYLFAKMEGNTIIFINMGISDPIELENVLSFFEPYN